MHECQLEGTHSTHCYTLQHTAVHCNTLQHAATRFNTLQRTAAHYSTFQQWSSKPHECPLECTHGVNVSGGTTHCNTLQHTVAHCNTLHYTCSTLQHTTTQCNTLQHTATHCNTLQLTALSRTLISANASWKVDILKCHSPRRSRSKFSNLSSTVIWHSQFSHELTFWEFRICRSSTARRAPQ